MSSITADDVSSPGVDLPTHPRLLEWYLFVATVVGGIGVAGSAMGGLTWTVLPMVLVGLVALGSFIAVPGMVYADAEHVEALDLDWTPRPARWGIITLLLTVGGNLVIELLRMPAHAVLRPLRLFYYNLGTAPPELHSMLLTASAPVGALYYLGRRYQHLGGRGVNPHWWVVLPAIVVVAVAYLAAELYVPGSLNRIAAGTMVLATLFPVAAYMDARHIRRSANTWNPNPAIQFLLAYLSVIVFPISILYACYAAYHLGRRWLGRTTSG